MTASALMIAPLGGLAAGFLAGSAGLTTAFLGIGGVYLLVTLCPVIFPSWKQLDGPAPAPPGSRPAVAAGPAPVAS
jgi:hypothetical protein